MVFSSGSSAGSALMPKNFHQNTIPAHRDNMGMKADAMGYGHDRALLYILFMQFLLLTKNLCDHHRSSGNGRQETGNGRQETGDRRQREGCCPPASDMLGITQHQTGVPRYGLVSFLMGDAHPTGLLNVITTRARHCHPAQKRTWN